MGVLVIILLVLSAVILLISRRDKETVLIASLDLSLAEFWLVMLIYISKKGGFTTNMQTLLFGTRQVRLYLQYLIFTLSQLGYVMAIGRFLFPLFLVWLALYYSRRITAEKKRWFYLSAVVFPALSLIVYYRPVFEWAIELNPTMIQLLVRGSLGGVLLYLALAVGLMLRELLDVTMPFYRRRFAARFLMIASLVILYGLYCPQDPAQVYLFYKNDYMGAQQGLWYLNPALRPNTYIFVFSLVIICTAIGVFGMFRYAWENIRDGQQENAIRRKFDAASKGASVFVHSVKNQLLANRVLLKRMGGELRRETPDVGTLREHYRQLAQNNDFMIERLEELYRSIRTNSIVLVEESVQSVFALAVERLRKKYPAAQVTCEAPADLTILCDKNHLSEALYNLLVNGWEAQSGQERSEPLLLQAQAERIWTVLNVVDHGKGLSKEQRKHMFEPFWSSKNTNYNWGMGLYYVRQIVKSHLGVLRVETQTDRRTTFIIQLPRFQRSAK